MGTKIVIKNKNITAFGGIFQLEDVFNRLFSKLIDDKLGLRSRYSDYQYSDILRTVASIYLCGGDHIEDITTYLGDQLRFRPGAKVPSSDTVCRALKELKCENTEYESDKGIVYHHNVAEKLNGLLLDMLLATGQLKRGMNIDLDFDHEFIPAGKHDALYSYKKARGYFPGVTSCGGMIIGVENRDGNANVKFQQSDTLHRMFTLLEQRNIKVKTFRADCGSYSHDIVEEISAHSELFYLRASNCDKRRDMYERHKDWQTVEINYEKVEVASFTINDFLEEKELRHVVQRREVKDDSNEGELFEKRYIYRAILTNDIEMSEQQVIEFYNKRGASERNFDIQNNDFGWGHLPFSFMDENTVFLLVTAMVKNFFLYIVEKLANAGAVGIKATSRLKRFVFSFISVPARWTRTARTWVLNIYSHKPYHLYLTS